MTDRSRWDPEMRAFTAMMEERGRAFPPGYLHDTWRDWLYWDIELEA